MSNMDLFGGETERTDNRISIKRKFGYRNYPGDNGELCKNCNSFVKAEAHKKKYSKCSLIGVSSSKSTDITQKGHCKRFQGE